ncbi:Hypothetical protein R9X50_00735000 [Acrodontium crateriforme]|uniref:Glycosyl transferase family 25 domain-containing protein n=1 Tax=Acrodontium crateriforme TaxID=150365 RepID=A0AAQ3MA23_9PEZI|nr:Hypothetical protein R9X50_00735000 [Acrodontium crateriforme]
MSFHNSLFTRRYMIVAGGLVMTFVLLSALLSPSYTTSTSSRLSWAHPRVQAETRHAASLDSVFNETLGFQKVFVLNLPARTDHRDSMSLAAALTGFQVEYADGVLGATVNDKYLPPGGEKAKLSEGMKGSWRAHLNIARMIVERNITSALILEDDCDWDLRIKSQLRTFAKASRLLVQPVRGAPSRLLDTTVHRHEGQKPIDIDINDQSTVQPTSSPYGDVDKWDLLWLGHCGANLPRATDETTPLGRVIISNDETVPQPHHLNMQFGNRDLLDEYANHTRVVTRTRANTCILAYALSQTGARRMLHELGVSKMSYNADIMMRDMCDGLDGRKMQTCLTVHPQLFQHHRARGPKAAFSDIANHKGEYNDQAFTRNIRWSTRLNFQQLLDGTKDYVDLFRDNQKGPDIGF